METRFTPGPWTIGDPNVPEQGEYGNAIGIRSSDDLVICDVWKDVPQLPARANAHLISAAPELYEALSKIEMAASFCAVPDSRERRELDAGLEAARAALSKVHEQQQIQQPSCALEPVALTPTAITQAQQPAVQMTLVLREGKAQAAYPRRMQAEVYASGYSSADGMELVDGTFSPSQPSDARDAALRDAIERMDRARNILTDGKPRPDCNWGMLDTTDLRAAVDSAGVRDDSAKSTDADSQK